MTITVRLPDELEARLRQRVADESIELSEFVRQAITDKLDDKSAQEKPSAYDVWKKHFTLGEGSGETDRSHRVKEILRAEFDAKRRRRQ